MAPSSLSHGATLLLLSLSVASAAVTCTLKDPSDGSSICGANDDRVHKTIYDLYLYPDVQPEEYTAEGCAAVCQVTPQCKSFNIEVGRGCEFISTTQPGSGFYDDPNSAYQAYDQSCFNCVDRTWSIPRRSRIEDSTEGLISNLSSWLRAHRGNSKSSSSTSSPTWTRFSNSSSSVPTSTAFSNSSSSTSSLTSTRSSNSSSSVPTSKAFSNSSSSTSIPTWTRSSNVSSSFPTGTPSPSGRVSKACAPISTSLPRWTNTSSVPTSTRSSKTSSSFLTGTPSSSGRVSKACVPVSTSLPRWTNTSVSTSTRSSKISSTGTRNSTSVPNISASVSLPRSTRSSKVSSTGSSTASIGRSGSSASKSSSSASVVSSSIPVPHITGSASAHKRPEVASTSTVYTTLLHTITSCDPSVRDCAVGSVTTKTVALYTTTCPVTATATPTQKVAYSAVRDHISSSSVKRSLETSTSTVYTTAVYTITSCVPGHKCSLGSVTTKTVALSTTVYTVTATPTPVTTSTVLTTSTVYATSVYTITSCAAGRKCSLGSVATKIVALSTTVCPVKAAPTPVTTTSTVLTTTTVYATSIRTITSCAPGVKCSLGHVTTKVVPLYTTVLPASATVTLTTSTVYTTSTQTITSCALGVPCSLGHVTTKKVPLYTTVCPATATPIPVETPFTTSTVYATSIHTVTSCAPGVPCSLGQVTTKVVPLYTTVCPPTATIALTTSTVYTTSTQTITSCVPGVPCSLGHVTTKKVPLYTTICPVAATHSEHPIPSATPVKAVPHGSAPVPVPDTTTYSTTQSTTTVYHTAVHYAPPKYPEEPAVPNVPAAISSAQGPQTTPAAAASTPKEPASYPALSVVEEHAPKYPFVPIPSPVVVTVYPTPPAALPSGYSNGTTSAPGAVETTSSHNPQQSVPGHPSGPPTMITANAGSVLGVQGWGIAGVVGLIGAAFVL